MRSGRGITSVEFDAEEFVDGDEFAAAAAFTTDAYVSAPQVAGVASPLAQETLLATRTLVNGLGDQTLFPPQLLREVSERGSVHLTVAESMGALPAGRAAIHTAAFNWKSPATHRAGRQGLAVVTRIVTYGVGTHAATACARLAARASSRRS